MIKLRYIILLIGMLGLINNTVKGQSCNPPPLPGLQFLANGIGCAPLDTRIETSFRHLNAGSEITIDWGDGSPVDVFITTATELNRIFTHTYPSNFMVCEYIVTATAVKNCVDRSSATISAEVTVWDDDQAGMNVSGPFYVCEGFAANIQFTDNSSWNCNPGTGLPNNDPRTLQWVYGIGGTTMQGVTVAGSASPPIHYGTQYSANNPGSQSLNVNVPATRPNGTPHAVGDRFYVQLNNWNFCNPQPMPPVTDAAFIEIVAPPQPIFETKLNDNSGPVKTDFCPGDVVYFDNDTPNQGANGYTWHIFDDPTGTNRISTSNNTNHSFSFSNSGQKLIRLYANATGVIGGCNVVYESTINIVDVPRADIQINAQAFDDDLIQFCEDPSLPTGYSVTFNNVSTGFLPNTEFYLDFYDENDVRFLFFASNFSTLTAKTVDFANPGVHKVILRAVDPVTTCETADTAYVEIYSRPVADFDVVGGTDICRGKLVDFDDLSVNFTGTWSGIPGDTITEYRWWFDYNGNPASSPDAVINNASNGDISHTFTTPGTYDVRLQVSKPFTNVCEIDRTIQVEVYDIPNASFTPDVTEGCPDLPVTLTNTSFPQPTGITIDYNWIITDLFDSSVDIIPYGNPTVDTTFNFSHTRGDNNNHQYTIQLETTSNIGCKTLSPVETITVYPAPNSGFSSDFDPFALNCGSVSANFQIDAYTQSIPNIDEFIWTIDDGNGNVTTINNPPANTALAHTFTNNTSSILNYTVRLEVNLTTAGCVVPFTRLVRVNPLPGSDFNDVVVDQTCDFVTVNIDAVQKGLAVYNWTLSAPTVNSPIFDDNFDLLFDRPEFIDGDLTVTMTLNTENLLGCTSPGTTSKTFVIPRKDDINVDLSLVSNNTFCNYFNAQFNNNSSASPAGTSWELFITRGSGIPQNVSGDVTGNLDGSGSGFSYLFTTAGDYLVELVATSPDGCIFRDSETLTVYPDVTASFMPSVTEGCGPLEVLFNENSYNQPDIQDKFWTIQNLTAGTVELPRQNTNLVGYTLGNPTKSFIDYAITLDIVSFNNCVDDTTIVVRVYPEPEVDFNVIGPDPSCAPYEVSFENISNNPAGTSYIWNWGDGTYSNFNDLDPGYSTSVSHTFLNTSYLSNRLVSVKLTAITPDNCITEVTKVITLNPQIIANIMPDRTSGCSPLTVNFDNFSQGDTSPNSAWYYTDPTTGIRTQFSDEFITSHTFINNSDADKTFLIEYEAVNVGGCTDIASTSITVHPEITASFSFQGGNEACSPYPITFSNDVIKSGVTYVWNWGDGSFNDTTTVENSIVHIFENASTSITKNFNVVLTAIDERTGCEASTSEIITIFPTIVTRVEADIPQGCGPLRVNFTNNTSGVGLTHTWYYRVKGTNDRLGTLNTAFASYELGNRTPDNVVYEVVYEVENTDNCQARETFDITVFPEIEANFTADPERQILPNKTVSVTNLSTPGNWEYHWDFGDGRGISDDKDPQPYEYETYGNYLITLTVKNPIEQCESQHSILIVIEPVVPVVDFAYDPGSGCIPLTVNFTNLSTGADANSYKWDFGDGVGFSNEVNPSYTYYKPGTYTVKLSATNEIGLVVTEIKEQIINVHDLPRASFVARPSLVYLPESPVIVQNYTVGGAEYHWDFGDGTTYNEYEPRHQYQEPGEYFIELVAINEHGCSDTLKVESAVTVVNGGQVKIPNVFTPNVDGPPSQGGGIGFASNDIFLPIVEGVVDFQMEIYNRWGEMVFATKDQRFGWDGYYKGRLSAQGVYLYKIELKFISGESTTRVGDVTLLR